MQMPEVMEAKFSEIRLPVPAAAARFSAARISAPTMAANRLETLRYPRRPIGFGTSEQSKTDALGFGGRFDPPPKATAGSYLSCVETLVKVVFRWVPIELTATTIPIEIPEAMRQYSMAVAPDSCLRNAITLDIREALHSSHVPRCESMTYLPRMKRPLAQCTHVKSNLSRLLFKTDDF